MVLTFYFCFCVRSDVFFLGSAGFSLVHGEKCIFMALLVEGNFY